jgi:hypothetical protein
MVMNQTRAQVKQVMNQPRAKVKARPGKAGNKVEAITNITALSSTREKQKKISIEKLKKRNKKLK